MARMNPQIAEQWERIAPSGMIKQADFFREKGVDPATGRAYLHKWRQARRAGK